MKFYTNWSPKKTLGEMNNKPSETVPDQSMTIQEIIARFVRSGSMPVAMHSDIGDNEAFEPEFEPLDEQPTEIVSRLRPASKEPEKEPDMAHETPTDAPAE